MGGRVTGSAHSAELARARLLQQALQAGSAPGFVSAKNEGNSGDATLSWQPEETPEIRRQYLEQLFASSPDAVCIVDLDHKIQCVNGEFERLFGYASAETLGRPIESLIGLKDRDAEARWIAERVTKGQSITLETQRRRKDGGQLDVSICSAPLRLEGRPVAFYAIYRDISERKRAEALSSALYRIAEKTNSARDLQQFFAAIHGIVDELMYARNFYIALYDPSTQWLSFPYFVDEGDAVALPRKMGLGLTEYVLRTGEALLATPEVFAGLVRSGQTKLIGKDSVDWMGVPLKAGDQTFGVLAIQSYSEKIRYHDRDKEILTFVSSQVASAIEHKRSEQALRRSEARYRSLVQSAVYGIYRSNQESQFLDVNPALISMLGYESAEELRALDAARDVFVDPREKALLMERFRSTGRLDGVEVRWKRKDGSAITVRLSGRAVSTADEPADVLEAIAEDVTERRILEDQFRQAQKMEAVGRLAGGVAHDFNNLLMVISGYTEVLLDQMEPSDRFYPKALAVQQASDRATTLTRQLLAFSRKQLLELKVVDVNAIVEDMERLLRPLIGETIELTTSFAPGVACTRADAGQLEQVLMNLVVNAKDAMPNGGRISIHTAFSTLDDSHRREQGFLRPGDYVMMSVTDTGAGMDKETQSRIFEPFFTTKETNKGTGLGLSTVYGIVKQSGGYVFVQSELGKGTTFSIYLPRVEEAIEPHKTAPVSHAAAGGTETVLLVEDEESVRELVRETLKSKGYRVIEADNGNSGLLAAEKHQGTIHLVITDVVMPELGGHELAQRILKSRPGTRVLYLSGYSEDAFGAESGMENGAPFLQKPFTLQSLSRKVREVLDANQ